MPLISRDDSVLIVVDLQPSFWGERLDAADAASAIAAARRASWLAGTATALGIPAVVTEEDSQRNGPTDPSVLAALKPGTPVFAKPVFGLADCPDITQAVESEGRRTAVLVGFETDVCVTHSAIGLADAGYRVVVSEDAVYSPFGAHAPGVARLRDLGVELLSCKSIYYDWIRTLPAARAFEDEHPDLADPPGFSL
ncbi:MAG: isochorismatase family protein [Nocardiopsaceae bacterium]|nr:isochorismatase family protein [Nocardiopsaceae bacterium]